MHRLPQLLFRALLLVALLAGCTQLAAPARADHLDQELFKEADKLLKLFKEKGYKNVGVLKFRVEQGSKPANFDVGPLNSNLTTRVENALILKLDPLKPLGIIGNLRQVATENKLPTYLNPKGRQALFDQAYQLAWGTDQVKADAFVGGLVKVQPDMKTAKVTLEVYDRQTNEAAKQFPEKLDFTVKVDRTLLTDIGQSFVLKKREFVPDDEVVNTVAATDAANRDKVKGDDLRKSEENRVSLEVVYNSTKQEIAPDPANNGELRVAEPKQGQTVELAIKNIGKEQIAVALLVNGKNTLYGETDKEPVRYSKWVLDPGTRYVIKGIYTDEKTYQPFKVLSDSEMAALTYNDYLGLIHVHVFLSSKDVPAPAIEAKEPKIEPKTTEPKKEDKELQEPAISLRGLRGFARPATAADLQRKVREIFQKERKGIGEDATNTKQADLQKDAFPNPRLQSTLTIRYYRPN